MEIKNEQILIASLHLLVQTKVEVETLKIMMIRKYLAHTGNEETDNQNIKEILAEFESVRETSLNSLLSQLANKYGGLPDIDDLIKSAL